MHSDFDLVEEDSFFRDIDTLPSNSDPVPTVQPKETQVKTEEATQKLIFKKGRKDVARVFPRRKAGELIRSTDKPVLLTKEMLLPYFGTPLRNAAWNMGLCPTALKSVCRKLGITRWPYKQSRRSSPTVPSPSDSIPSSEASANVTPVMHRDVVVQDIGTSRVPQQQPSTVTYPSQAMNQDMDIHSNAADEQVIPPCRPYPVRCVQSASPYHEMELSRAAGTLNVCEWDAMVQQQAKLFPSLYGSNSWEAEESCACDMSFLTGGM